MAIAQTVAGFTLGQADILRRAMGKKKKSELDKQYEGFDGRHERAAATPTTAIKTLWDILLPFSDYAFNKAHSRRPTAWCPTGPPTSRRTTRPSTWRALLTSVGDDKDKLGALPQRVPRAWASGAAAGRQRVDRLLHRRRRRHPLRPRRGAQRRVRTSSSRSCAAREEQGRSRRFHDFLRKVPDPGRQQAHHRVARSRRARSTRSGATRRALLEIHEDAVDAAVSVKRNEAHGQVGFDFDSLWDEPRAPATGVPASPEWAKRDKLAFEREMLGPLRLRPPARRASSAHSRSTRPSRSPTSWTARAPGWRARHGRRAR